MIFLPFVQKPSEQKKSQLPYFLFGNKKLYRRAGKIYILFKPTDTLSATLNLSSKSPFSPPMVLLSVIMVGICHSFGLPEQNPFVGVSALKPLAGTCRNKIDNTLFYSRTLVVLPELQ